jgi:hypothetical protein
MHLIGNLTPDQIKATNNALLAQATHLGGSSIASENALSSMRCTEFGDSGSACVAVILTGKAEELKDLADHIGKERGLEVIWNLLTPAKVVPTDPEAVQDNESGEDS